MAKTTKLTNGVHIELASDPVIDTEKHEVSIAVEITPVEKPLYLPASWKNVVTVYKCETCGHCTNLEDDMILHVITHPKLTMAGRMELFERLIKEKK